MKTFVIFAFIALAVPPAVAQNRPAVVELECRNLAGGGNNFLEPNETYLNGMACHPVAQTAQLPAAASLPEPAVEKKTPVQAGPCLTVNHKNLVGRRVAWFVLTGIPIAPGANFDYVDSEGLSQTKRSYKGKDLEKLQAAGVRVIVAEKGSGASCARAAN